MNNLLCLKKKKNTCIYNSEKKKFAIIINLVKNKKYLIE